MNWVAPEFGLGLSNRFKVQVVERGQIVYETPFTSNLILDTGLDQLVQRSIPELFTYCVIGTGQTPVEDPSGAITATTSGTTVTASSSFFSTTDVGKLLRFNTGEKSKITGYIDPFTVTVADNLNVTTPTGFSLWRVNQTALTSEVKRSGTYLPGVGNCGTTTSSDGVVTMQRTYDFTAETTTVQYAEVGFSHTSSAGANINMRGLIPGGPITIVPGQQIRVVYFFRVRLSPITPLVRSVDINGWPAKRYAVAADPGTDRINLTAHGFPAGTEIRLGGVVPPSPLQFNTPYYVINTMADSFQLAATPGGSPIDITSTGTDLWLVTNTRGSEQLVGLDITTVGTDGSDGLAPGGYRGGVFEPFSNGSRAAVLYNTKPSLPTWPNAGPLGSWIAYKTVSLASYVPGSFTRTASVTFAANEANSSNIVRIALARDYFYQSGYVFTFDWPQEKSNLYTLTLTFRWRWDREFF